MVFILVSFAILILLTSLVLYLNDYSLPTKSTNGHKRVLIVFPHPDDEAKSMAGTIKKFTEQGAKVTLLLFSKGERGTPDASEDLSLKKIRSMEAKNSAKILGVKLIHEDFGDGVLPKKRSKLTSYLKKIIAKEKPDLIITYDRSGLYGHPDHVVVSEIITELHKKMKKSFALWYVSFPEKLLAGKKLPIHMADDPDFAKHRKQPNIKIWIGHRFITKSKVIGAYKSQFPSYERGLFMPIPNIVVWSLFPWEYFYEVE